MKSGGFTLIELLIGLAVAGILLGLSGPALQQQRAATAVRTASGQVMAALHLARRTALASGQSVTVCPSLDAARCGLAGSEWLMFANLPGGSEARREEREPILRRWHLPSGVQVAGSRGYAAFQPRPGAAATVTFEFRHARSPQAARSIVVSQTGRPRLAAP